MLNKETKYLDITHIPELLRLAEEVQNSRESRVLTRDGKELAIVSPAKPAAKRQGRVKGQRFSMVDPLWQVVGIGPADEGPTDVSENTDKYLAEAYLPKQP